MQWRFGESYFRFVLFILLCLIGDTFISPHQVCFAHDGNFGEQSACPYLDLRAFHHTFSSCPIDGEGVRKWLGEHLAASQGQHSTDSKPHQCKTHLVPLWI